METEGYAYRTQYPELKLLEQTIVRRVKEVHLQRDVRIELQLERPAVTHASCWHRQKDLTMLEH